MPRSIGARLFPGRGRPLVEEGVGVRAGEVLAGKYRVERVLGAGGMGVVVAAHHIQLDEKVALKFLLPQALENPEAVARFDREARAAVKIKSEHVARIIDVGRLETGAPYMVMEYLEGGDLAAWVRQRGPMPVEQVVEFVLQACEAIAEAHALGIVHRDLKPSNLFWVRRADGLLSVKVLDFGISKVERNQGRTLDAGMTRTSAILGSPLYMSPEQLQSSRGVDARTDVWSLGVILFELVSGRLPFDAGTVTELVIRIATEPPVPLRTLRSDLPPGFENVVARCLEKDRDVRFQNVGELAVALRDYAPRRARANVERVLGTLHEAGLSRAAMAPSGRDTTAAVHPDQPRSMGRSPETFASWGRTGAGRKSTTAVLVASLLAAGLFAVGGGTLLAKRLSAFAPAATSSATSAAAANVQASIGAPAIASETPAEPSASASPATDSIASSPAPPATESGAAPAALPPDTAKPWQTPAPHASVKAPAPAVTTVTTVTTAAAPKPACTPPFYVDSAGRRRYKPECL
jgi:serine/threonine-protein kinase